MDGAMPKTVLIILAAVVALIVIVVLTGMRYLRADDDDDFDDDISAEHGRSRSRGGHPAAGHARARQAHADDLADQRQRERVGATRGARPTQGREDRGTDQRGMDQRGSSRAGQDHWRDDSTGSGRSGRAAATARDQRPPRAARRDYDDISEPLPAARTAGTPARGRGADDYDSLPGRRSSSADYDRDPRERRNRRDRAGGYDNLDGRDPRETRDRRDRSDVRPGRDRRDRANLRDSRPAASVRDDADRGEMDRRSNTGPQARPDFRKNGSKPDAELLPALKPRQSKNKRESEGDWPSNEWDELSDVDYWAELASDKPFSAPSVPEAPRSERRDSRAGRDGRMDRDSLPVRDARQDSGVSAEAITKQMSRPPREPDSGILPAARHRELSADRPTAPRSDPRPAVNDDDPLTSPSFPRVSADDSRSYRRSRSAPSPDSRYDGANGRTGDVSPYPSMPPVDPMRGFDSASTTRRHALPAASSDRYTSLPSSPGHPNFQGQDSANGSYPAAEHYGEPSGYQATASYPSAASADYPRANGSPAGGYLPPAPDNYRSDFGATSYRGGAGYEATGYEPSGNHSLPPSPTSYGNGASEPGGDYLANGYQGGDYQGYSGRRSASGSHRRPEPSYPDENYQGHNGYGTGGLEQPANGATHYQSADYDQAGYPLPAPEQNGYAGADPYAVDPYSQHGYGGNGY
jgi:hypothetical protein